MNVYTRASVIDRGTVEFNESFDSGLILDDIERLAAISVPFARQIAVKAARSILDDRDNLIYFPQTKMDFLLQQGNRQAVGLEAGLLEVRNADIEINKTGVAAEAASIELFAAAASDAERESEATGLLGAGLSIAMGIGREGNRLFPLIPTLVKAVTSLARFLHRQGERGRHLLRLFPAILHRTIASLGTLDRLGGDRLTPALTRLIMANQTARVLGNADLVRRAITRNVLVRDCLPPLIPSSNNEIAKKRKILEDYRFHKADNSNLPHYIPKIAGKLALGGATKLALAGAKKLIDRAPKILQTIQRFRYHPLSQILREGEREATALETKFFGSNEFEGELVDRLAAYEAAHAIALTELLAHRAAHSEGEWEAEALLGKALPIAVRVMSGRTMLRQATPALLQANRYLVRGLHRQGREGRQFLRVAAAIQRRTIASLQAIRARGGQITPDLASRLMTAHTERVLGTPSILGKALVRNFAIYKSL